MSRSLKRKNWNEWDLQNKSYKKKKHNLQWEDDEEDYDNENDSEEYDNKD